MFLKLLITLILFIIQLSACIVLWLMPGLNRIAIVLFFCGVGWLIYATKLIFRNRNLARLVNDTHRSVGVLE